jgi:hypothetical protein
MYTCPVCQSEYAPFAIHSSAIIDPSASTGLFDGDEPAFQYHVTRCLDSTAVCEPSPSSPCEPSVRPHCQRNGTLSPSGTGSNGKSRESHAVLSQFYREGQDSPKDRPEPGVCPVCAIDWEVLGLSGAERDEHASICLDSMRSVDEDADDNDGSTRRGGFGLPSSSDVKEVNGKACCPHLLLQYGNWSNMSSDVVPVLATLLARSHASGRTKAAVLCSPDVAYINGQRGTLRIAVLCMRLNLFFQPTLVGAVAIVSSPSAGRRIHSLKVHGPLPKAMRRCCFPHSDYFLSILL